MWIHSTLLATSLLLGLTFQASLAAAPKAAKNKVIVDPAVAAKDVEYQIQGEYKADCCGAQVVALGDNKFRAVLFDGGLPGAGWNRGDEKAEAEGTLAGGEVVFKGGFEGTLKNEVLNIKGRGDLQKETRKSPTLGAKPPKGAVVVFDGKARAIKGNVTDDGLLKEGAVTTDKFGSFKMHVEFRTPFEPHKRGQGRGNSGFYIHNRYEVQVLDSFGLEGAYNEAGSLYRFKTPDVNMALPPLVWQTYDIDFTAAKFDASGKKIKNARITVRHNGVVVQDNVELPKGTGNGGRRAEVPAEHIHIQNHSNPVRFRNIWIIPK